MLRLLALLLCGAVALAEDAPPLKSCPAECSKHGNCGDNGECMCPFGRTGQACETDFLAPCRLGPDSPATCDFTHPQSCECVRRCREYGCPTVGTNGTKTCHWQIGEDDIVGCFERPGVQPDQQYSAVPEKKEAAKYFASSKAGAAEVERSVALVSQAGKYEALPPSECSQKCNGRGKCIKAGGAWTASCACFSGYSGKACAVEDTNNCPLNCLGRGKCSDGFCHCNPPYFSLGCSRQKVYPPIVDLARISPVNFKIYMYELPTQLAYDVAAPSSPEAADTHIAHKKFIEHLLMSNVRTEDPAEANLFFVPALSWAYAGNQLNSRHLDLVIDHINSSYPFWNRTGGKDHFFWLTNDRGACALTGLAQPAIKLTHFGLHTRNGSVEGWDPASIVDHEFGCHHPLRDVVMPPHDSSLLPLIGNSRQLTVDDIISKKSKLFYFSGSVSDNPQDSGNTTQQLKLLVNEWRDRQIVFDTKEDVDESRLRSSKFCLAVYGSSFGVRLLRCMFAGSVPVVIQEHVVQPFEELLPYETFSLRLSNAKLPELREILRDITDAQYRKLQEGMVRYRDALHWDVMAGGRAFDYTIAALRRRFLNFKSLYY
ncbi:hypothetical protein D9Q98_005123 [Chlorella vulgaris]|uniref:EGF-like domain-containing protein n=1 Tax=Chlorella vulgaris TaxID=3077 RepID=A0A9D4TNH5_CHLVU|nr:hypothetical protein D9Q98_005123 [Chlorella vulgaris]